MENYLEDKRKIPIFAGSSVCFDYAAECGEQDLIDTTPFNSHLRVAFFKTYSYSIIKGYLCNENIKNDNEWRSS